MWGRWARTCAAVMLILSVGSACDQATDPGTSPTTGSADEPVEETTTLPPDEPPEDQEDPEDVGVSAPVVIFGQTETCHDFHTAGGNSDGRFYGSLDGGSGVLAITVTVKDAAPGSPTTRTVTVSVPTAGPFVAVFPLYAVGEKLSVSKVVLDGTTVTGASGYLEVAPLDAPACQALAP